MPWVNRTSLIDIEASPSTMAGRFPADVPFIDGAGLAASNVVWLWAPSGSANAAIVASVIVKYRKIAGDVLSEMTPAEKTQADADELAAQIAVVTAALKSDVNASTPLGVDVRALIQNPNRRINFVTNRLIELGNIITAMLNSTGAVASMRTDGLAQVGTTLQTTEAAALLLNTSTRQLPAAIADYEADVDDPGVSS